MSSVDLAVRETLPVAERAILRLVKAREAASVGDADTFLGIGPELAGQIMRRLERQGMVVRSPASPRPTAARIVNPASAAALSRWGLTAAGTNVLAAGSREFTRRRRLRLLVAADPPIALRVLPPPRYARTSHELPLELDDVPDILRDLGAHLAIDAPERSSVFGMSAYLAAIPGGDHVAGRFLGFSEGATYEVRHVGERHEAWLAAAWSPESESWATHVVVDRRGGAETRRVTHVGLDAIVPDNAQSSDGILTELLAQGLNASRPWVDGALPVYAESGPLENLLGDHDRPVPQWITTRLGALTGYVRVRGRPASRAAAHSALMCFLSRRPREIATDLSRAVIGTWRDLAAFWETERHEPPSEAWIREHLWADRNLRAALCRGRLQRDLVEAYDKKDGDRG